MKKLTAEQQKLVTDNHRLILKYIGKNKLELNEYYDLCAIGLCKAVQNYDKSKGTLSTLAFICMDNEIKNYHIKMARNTVEKNTCSYYIETKDDEVTILDAITNIDQNFENKVIFKLQFLDKVSKLTHHEKMIVSGLLQGYTRQAIADEVGISRQRVDQIIKKNLKRKIGKILK